MKRSDASTIVDEAIAKAKREVCEAEAACATWEKAHAELQSEVLDHQFTIKELSDEVERWRKEVAGVASGATYVTLKNLIKERDTLKSQVEQRDVVLEECEKVLAIDLKELFISTPVKLKWIELRNEALATIHKLKGGTPP